MMKDQKKQFPVRMIQAFLLTVVIILAFAAGFDFYYDLNDDTTIKDILSGAYCGTPSGHSVQMLYPLGALIAALYRAIPGISWYGLFLCLCQFGVLFLIIFRITKRYFSKKTRLLGMLLAALLYAGLLFRELIIVQYSITSAICMAGAIFLYVTGDIKKSTAGMIKENAVPVLLVILSFMIRTEMCLMLVPFLLLAGLFRMITDVQIGKIKCADVIRRNMIIAGLAVVGMLVMISFDSLSKKQDAYAQSWSRFDSFFDARTKLYDFYELPPYEENKDFYHQIGLSEESYRLLENYNFSLDDSIDEHLLSEIVTYIEQEAGISNQLHSMSGLIYTKHTIKEGIWLYGQHIKNVKGNIWGIVNDGMYFLAFFTIAGKENRKRTLQIIKLLCLFGIRSGLFIYLLMVDRVLDRVTIPLYLAEFTLLAGWQILQAAAEEKKKDRVFIYIFLMICGLTGLCYNGTGTVTEYQNRERVNPRWEAFIKYCKYFPDDYFVMDVYSSTSYEGVPYAEKIFKNVDNSLKNYDICGGWISKSPLYREKLKHFQIDNLEAALCQKEQKKHNVYFVAAHGKDLGWLSAYYRHKGQKIQMKQVDTIWYQNEAIFDIYDIEPEE